MRVNESNVEDRVERALDDALEMTFPASDPIAVYMPASGIAPTGDERVATADR